MINLIMIGMAEKERRISRLVRLESYNAFLIFFGVIGLVLVLTGAVGLVEKETFPILKEWSLPMLISGVVLMVIGFALGFHLNKVIDKIQDKENHDHEDGLYKI